VNAWPLVDLEEVSDISAGNPAPQGTDHFCDDGHPFVRMQDVGRKHIDPALVETTDRVSPLAVRECGLRLYPAGTLLIPKSGASVNLNHRAMLGQDAYVVSHLATIIPDRRKVLPSYLFHWSQRYDPRSQAQVTSLPSLPLSLIKAAKVPLPPLEEQRRIVGLLDRSAEIRHCADIARAKARAIIPALFIDMFGDPATNPKGWPVTSFGDMVTNHDNRRKPVKASDRERRKGKYPYYGASGIIDYVDEFIFDERALLIAEDGANLLSRSTPIAFQAEGKYWVNNHAHIVTSNGKARLDYLEVFLNLRDLKDWITGSAQPKLNQANLNRIPVPLPPLPLQTAFAAQAQRLEATARTLDAAAAKAEAMAAALSAEVFGASVNGNAAYG